MNETWIVMGSRGRYRLRTNISKRNLKYAMFGRSCLPKVIRLALVVKNDHLGNNAATSSASCINGCRWGGLGLGGVGGDGKEVSEEIHLCDCVVGG